MTESQKIDIGCMMVVVILIFIFVAGLFVGRILACGGS